VFSSFIFPLIPKTTTRRCPVVAVYNELNNRKFIRRQSSNFAPLRPAILFPIPVHPPRSLPRFPVQACLVSRQLPVSIPGIEHAAFSASDDFDCQKCQQCQIAGNASILAMP
jgi:hypothetical protein